LRRLSLILEGATFDGFNANAQRRVISFFPSTPDVFEKTILSQISIYRRVGHILPTLKKTNGISGRRFQPA